MVVAMYALLRAHSDCLPDSKLVNDDETNAISQGVAFFCPFVHKALESLCRAESISSRKLLTIAACHILQLNIFDAKLCTFAIGQFHNCFSSLLDGRRDGDWNNPSSRFDLSRHRHFRNRPREQNEGRRLFLCWVVGQIR
jgi:hypothetical protein